MSISEDNLRQAARQGIARMKDRRQAEQWLAEVASEYPEEAAKEMLVFATSERYRLRRQLLETFGFSVSQERSGFRCRLAGAPPGRFENRKQLGRLLVESIWLGKRQQDGRTEDQITYRFGSPLASEAESNSSMPGFKNGSRS